MQPITPERFLSLLIDSKYQYIELFKSVSTHDWKIEYKRDAFHRIGKLYNGNICLINTNGEEIRISDIYEEKEVKKCNQ
jgi:hypothetical protein